ncbi:MAG: glycine cleavage system aminomethyltransferase GcvT [Saprospiraceae bacterium]|jgi:aminomethyltransferase|nr:glycine cleavage system aminomethyltransferase GcvT [Saprospiraceae bacterium]MBP9193977.1 glycine cleavage system aminomethyltransferase GcvT [Saprospiraceae bacterium]
MKPTPLTQKHIDLGAKMAEFAGYNMPISYSGIIEEHQGVRKRVGVFDVSHMGEFIVKGKQALDLVQAISSNDASKLNPGDAQYSCLPNDKGGIVDDMLVYRLFDDMCAEGEQAFMLVVNASNIEKDWNWISALNNFDTRLINISDETGLIAVQGPKAEAALQKLTDVDLSKIAYYHFAKGTIAGAENVILSATGYTGSGGFELYCRQDQTADLWDAVMRAGAEFDIIPAGLGARDTLRLEMGYCLYGNDIDDTTSPLEAGLGWITKLKKNTNFPSKSIFEQQKKDGLMKQLVGFTMTERRVPRHGYPVCDADGLTIGEVTSGTQSPSLDQPIGMAYVSKGHSAIGSKIYIKVGSKQLEAEVTSLPFLTI